MHAIKPTKQLAKKKASKKPGRLQAGESERMTEDNLQGLERMFPIWKDTAAQHKRPAVLIDEFLDAVDSLEQTRDEIRRCWEEREGLREVLEYIASGDCADPAGWADLALKEEAKR